MNKTHKELIQNEFRSLKRSQVLLAIPAIAIFVFMVSCIFFAPDLINKGLWEFEVFGFKGRISFFIILFPYAVFLKLRWKCPNCGYDLGKKLNHGFCPNCKIKLMDRQK